MKYLVALHLLASLPSGWAMQKEAAQPPSKVELRNLEFGELNFLHTTDTHGWLAGHLKQGSYSADWGDYITFSELLKEKLAAEEKDLIIIDSGDKIRGNGLYGADQDPLNPGDKIYNIFKKQSFDLLTIGNHELYEPETAFTEHEKMVAAYGDSYLVANLALKAPGDKWGWVFKPFSQKNYTKITTTYKKINILAFGIIYNGAVKEDKIAVHITPVEQMVKQSWFTEAINEKDVDIFVVVGHVPARPKPRGDDRYKKDTEFRTVHDAIRKSNSPNKNKPIHFFGGDYHIRDYVEYDRTSRVLASGMYLETIGFASIKGIEHGEPNENMTFTRRYIDNNVHSFQHHTGKYGSNFTSENGRKATEYITQARSDLKLDTVLGCSPKHFWMNHRPFHDEQNLYGLLARHVFREGKGPPERQGKKRMVFLNKGAIRYDFYKGEFTRDTAWSILPFESPMVYIPDVPWSTARNISNALEELRRQKTKTAFDLEMEMAPQSRYLQEDCPIFGQGFPDTQAPLDSSRKKFSRPLGYVTTDDLGDDGDDTVHSPILNCRMPDIIEGVNFNRYDPGVEYVDVVFNDYLQPNMLQVTKKTENDVKSFSPNGGTERQEMRDFIADWVKAHWSKPENGTEDNPCNLKKQPALSEAAEL